MRKISNYQNNELRQDQLNVLIDVLGDIKDKKDLRDFFTTFMTESELAYIGQRLNIMRMFSKNFSYEKIQEKLNVPSNTIARVKIQLENGGENLLKIISQYKYKSPKPKKTFSENNDSGNGFVRALMPGAIRRNKYKK